MSPVSAPHPHHAVSLSGSAGFKRGGRRSALLCWLGGLDVGAAGAWLMRLLRMGTAGGGGSRKPLLGSAKSGDTAGAAAAAAATAGLTASATGERL
jgi:hypothetical protein